jgi:hypothetical protein
MSTTATPDTVQLSRRELRLICRRLLVAHDAPAGMIPAVAEAMVDGIALGLPMLDSRVADFGIPVDLAGHRSPSWSVAGTVLSVQGHHEWTPLLVPAVADLVQIAVERHAITLLTVNEVSDAGLVEAARARLSRASIMLARTAESGVWAVSRGEDAAQQQAQRRLVFEGVTFGREDWLRLYRSSLRGLTPESEESFRHAGYVDASGEPISGMDDDHDIEAALSGLAGSSGA